MNDASRWRLELAEDVASWFRDRRGLAMVLAGGSAARGQADDYSDLDVAVYWDDVDPGWLATPPLASSGAQRFKLHEHAAGEVYVEQYRLGEAKMDVVHIGLDWWDRLVADVVERSDTSSEKQDLISGFLDAHVIDGKSCYAHRRSRLLPYPEALAVRMVQQHLFFYPAWVLRAHDVDRKDWLSFYSHLTAAVRNVLGILAGVNRMYVAAETAKRTTDVFASMKIAPQDLSGRVNELWDMRRPSVPDALGNLVAELLDLVDQHLPQVDTSIARSVNRFHLGACRERPDFRRPH
jgi:hypothetical protein